MNTPMREGKWRQWINFSAAILFALILLGSLIIQLVNSNNSANQTDPKPVPTISQITPAQDIHELDLVQTTLPKHGWHTLVTLQGVGNQTLNARMFKLPKIWATSISCQGNGQLSIHVRYQSEEATDTISCVRDTKAKPKVIIEPYYGYTTNVQITTTQQAHWQLRIIGCQANVSTCGLRPAIFSTIQNHTLHQNRPAVSASNRHTSLLQPAKKHKTSSHVGRTHHVALATRPEKALAEKPDLQKSESSTNAKPANYKLVQPHTQNRADHGRRTGHRTGSRVQIGGSRGVGHGARS